MWGPRSTSRLTAPHPLQRQAILSLSAGGCPGKPSPTTCSPSTGQTSITQPHLVTATSPDLLILPRSDGCSWKPQGVPTAGQPSTLLPSSGSTGQLGELGCTPFSSCTSHRADFSRLKSHGLLAPPRRAEGSSKVKEPAVLNRSSVGFGETARGRALGLNCGGFKPSPRGSPTLVEVGERFVVELHRRGRGRAQHVLEGQNFVLVLRRQTRFFLFEDGQGKDVTEKRGDRRSFRPWLQGQGGRHRVPPARKSFELLN